MGWSTGDSEVNVPMKNFLYNARFLACMAGACLAEIWCGFWNGDRTG